MERDSVGAPVIYLHYGVKVNGEWTNGWYHPKTLRQMVPFIEVGHRVVVADWRFR